METERTREARITEKNDLQGLNDRLEAYVAHHRSKRTALEAKEAELEELNKKHAKALSDVEKHYSVEVGKLSDQLKAANARAREEAEGRIKAQSELTSALAGARDTAELRAQIAKLTESADRSRAEAKAATDRRVASEAALKDERMDNSRLSSELKIAQAELASLRGQLSTTRSELTSVKAARESESKHAKENFTHKLAEAKASWDNHYKDKLAQLETQLRKEYDAEMKELRQREKDLRETVDRLRVDFAKAAQEAAGNHTFANELLARISRLEESHKSERLNWEQTRAEFEGKLGRALAEKAAKVDEFNRLMDVKITLQAEIDHYRRIIEDEESATGLPSPAPPARNGTSSPLPAPAQVSVGRRLSGSWLGIIGMSSAHTEEASPAPATRRAHGAATETTTAAVTSSSTSIAARSAASASSSASSGGSGRRSASSGRGGGGGKRSNAHRASADVANAKVSEIMHSEHGSASTRKRRRNSITHPPLPGAGTGLTDSEAGSILHEESVSGVESLGGSGSEDEGMEHSQAKRARIEGEAEGEEGGDEAYIETPSHGLPGVPIEEKASEGCIIM